MATLFYQFLRSSHLNTERNVNVLSSLFAKKPSKRSTALSRRTRMKVLSGTARMLDTHEGMI